MPDSIWDATLAEFRDRLATRESVPAGVSTAAVSAAFALGLLVKVLEIASKRKDFQGDRQRAADLIAAAQKQSKILSHSADEDIIAFRERLRGAMEVPLRVARAAASGLELCNQDHGMIHAAIAPDLYTAATLLKAAVDSSLSSLKANVEQLPAGDPFGEEVMAGARELLQKCETIKRPWQPVRWDR